MITAALRFQPTKRPQLSTQKAKGRPAFPKAPPPGGANTASSTTTGLGAHPAQPLVKTSIADWTGDDDDVNGFYGADRRQRGSRKKRKKNKEEPAAPQDWDDIYDPARPNSYEEYKHSEEKIREIREWKDRLYAHRMARRRSSDVESDDGGYSRQGNRMSGGVWCGCTWLTETRAIRSTYRILLRAASCVRRGKERCCCYIAASASTF